MILEIYLTLLFLCIVFIVIGYWRDIPFFYSAGFAILFFCGIEMMNLNLPFTGPQGIDYKTGSVITDAGSTHTVVYTYANYTNHEFGFVISFMGFVLFILALLQRKVKYK